MQSAARSGRWKYLKVDDKTERLFDLLADEREQADYRAAQPELFERLRADYLKWDAQVLKRPSK